MTKYLSKLSIFLITLCIFLHFCGAVDAGAESYAKVLAKLGFSINTYKTVNFTRPNYKNYFLFLTSQGEEFSETELGTIKQFDHFIVICDTPFQWDGIDFCNLNGVQVEDKYARTNFIPVYDNNIKGKHYIVVSEEALTSTLYMERLSRYFEASKMLKEEETVEEIIPEEDVTLIQQYLHKIPIFIGGILLISALFGHELLDISRNPKMLLDIEKYKGLTNLITVPLKGFYRLLMKYRKFLLHLAAYSVLFTGLISVYAISITARENSGVNISFAYGVEYLIKTLHPRNFAFYIKENSHPELVLVISYTWTLLVVCACRVTNITQATREFIKLISTKEVKKEFLRLAIPLLSISTLAITVYLSPAKTSALLIGFIFLMSYLVFLAYKNRIDINTLYSPGIKIVLFFVLSLTIVGVLALKRADLKNVLPETLPLVEEGKEVVVLPLARKYREKSHFADYFIELNSSLFIDDYLVYKPGFTKIINKNIADFKLQGNFIIENPSKEDLAIQLVQSEELRTYMGVEETTSLFFVENFNFDPEAVYSVNLGVTCENTTIKPAKVKVKTYFFDAKIVDQEFNIINFPGCTPETQDSWTDKQFTAPFKLIVIPDGSIVVFELKGIPEQALTNFSILENGRPYEQKFVLYDRTKDYLVRDGEKNDSTVYYYSWDIQEGLELNFDTSPKINVSKIVNEMKNRGILENPLTIWSPEEPHAIIKNQL